jgi:phosphonatase-like hydrolase
MSPLKFDLVVFDLSGTTVCDNNDVTNVLRHTLKVRTGLDVTLEQANALLGSAKDVSLADILTRCGRPHQPTDPFVQELLADFEERMIHHYDTDPNVRELADAGKVFASLRSMGVKVAADTGFSRKVATSVLRRLGWDSPGILDAWITADQVKSGRPAPYMIFHLMEQLGVTDVSRVVKVGDTPVDIGEGKAARCGLTVGVLSGSHSANQLSKHQPDALIPDIGSLPELLQK